MRSKKKFIVANWKMNGNRALCSEFASVFSDFKKDCIKVIVAPPFVYVNSLLVSLKRLDIVASVAGQNCHFKDHGTYTGDVSAFMLYDAGCRYVILGHSERRKFYAEADDSICQKAEAAINANLIPIICIGEIDKNSKEAELKKQCQKSLPKNKSNFIIAYEPVYAIGTGLTPTNSDIKDALDIIQSQIGKDLPIIYGGSVDQQNCATIASICGLQGLLVGGASLNPQHFLNICKAI